MHIHSIEKRQKMYGARLTAGMCKNEADESFSYIDKKHQTHLVRCQSSSSLNKKNNLKIKFKILQQEYRSMLKTVKQRSMAFEKQKKQVENLQKVTERERKQIERLNELIRIANKQSPGSKNEWEQKKTKWHEESERTTDQKRSERKSSYEHVQVEKMKMEMSKTTKNGPKMYKFVPSLTFKHI